jgi:hypothetical protein
MGGQSPPSRGRIRANRPMHPFQRALWPLALGLGPGLSQWTGKSPTQHRGTQTTQWHAHCCRGCSTSASDTGPAHFRILARRAGSWGAVARFSANWLAPPAGARQADTRRHPAAPPPWLGGSPQSAQAQHSTTSAARSAIRAGPHLNNTAVHSEERLWAATCLIGSGWGGPRGALARSQSCIWSVPGPRTPGHPPPGFTKAALAS